MLRASLDCCWIEHTPDSSELNIDFNPVSGAEPAGHLTNQVLMDGWSVCTHRPLVELHLSVSEIWKLFEGIDGDQNWADVGLMEEPGQEPEPVLEQLQHGLYRRKSGVAVQKVVYHSFTVR